MKHGFHISVSFGRNSLSYCPTAAPYIGKLNFYRGTDVTVRSFGATVSVW